MGDSSHVSSSSRRLNPMLVASKRRLGNCLVASPQKGFSQKTLKCITSVKEGVLGSGAASDAGMFLVKTAALEIVRRYSRAKCPIVWRGLQALQVLCYLPIKCIQAWDPFKALVKYLQLVISCLSRKTWTKPLLVLTIATIFSNQSACKTEKLNSLCNSQANSELLQEPPSQLSISDTRSCDKVTASVATKRWLQQLHKDLEKQGITLPERFYDAANGDFLRLLSSIKKTLRWRQTYAFLSPQELEAWSHLVFWHGYDVQLRPCLIIRLGLAFSNLRSDDRNLFAKAVGLHVFLINIENGVMHLVNLENSKVTVLMDCNGLSLGFPMQMVRSCTILLQDHYPNRLGYLIVVRLPPFARVITKTMFQVMRRTTQQKQRYARENDRVVVSKYLQTLPSFVGGNCLCRRCSEQVDMPPVNAELVPMTPRGHLVLNENEPSLQWYDHLIDAIVSQNGDQMMRIAIMGILMMWICVAFVLARHYRETLTLFELA